MTNVSTHIKGILHGEQAIELLVNCPEPMIYEIMLDGVWMEEKNGEPNRSLE